MMRPSYRYAAAVVAGLALAAAFPIIGVAGLAWVAPGFLLLPAIGVDAKRTFRLGYTAGFAHHLASLYWLLHIPVFKLAPIIGWMILSAFLALYPATWVWLCWRLFPKPPGPSEPLAATADRSSIEVGLDQILIASWGRRCVWAISCAALWVALEMIQARLFSGFPWNLLGSSQFRMLPILPISAITGIYGVSFLAVWFGVSLLLAALVVVRRSTTPRRWMWEILPALLVMTALIAGGYRTAVQSLVPPQRTLRLALVQPSIPQQWIWDPQERSTRFAQLLDLSRQAMEQKPDVVVWPEAAVPGFARWDTNTHDTIVEFARSNRVWMILGSDDLMPRAPGAEDYDVFNASFLVNPRGEFVGRYAKRRLVMFGEYIPFARWLRFLERWTGMGSFTPGDGPVAFAMPDLGVKTSVLICFEDVFPHVTRESVEADTDFLLNLTNNGWFGESAAQWQHAAAAVFRAVENGRPLVRCANNGLTCWVDAAGRMHDVYFAGTSDIYGRGIKLADVPIGTGRERGLTFYSRYGDVFGWSCVVLSGLLVGRRRKRQTCLPAKGV